jgi:protein-tyrosine phosphatase
VHCQAGVSRSATIVIAYLMHQRGMTLMEAFQHVRSLRSIVAPNLSFMGQLLAFEQTLRKVACAFSSSSSSLCSSLTSEETEASLSGSNAKEI